MVSKNGTHGTACAASPETEEYAFVNLDASLIRQGCVETDSVRVITYQLSLRRLYHRIAGTHLLA